MWTVYFRNQGGSLIARFRREWSDRIDIGCTAPVLSNASSLYTKECSPLPNVVVSSLGFRLVGAEASARAAAADSTTAAQKRSSGVDQERGGGEEDVAAPSGCGESRSLEHERNPPSLTSGTMCGTGFWVIQGHIRQKAPWPEIQDRWFSFSHGECAGA